MAIRLLFESATGEVIEVPTQDYLQSFEVRFSNEDVPQATLSLFDHAGEYLEKLLIVQGMAKLIKLSWKWDDHRSTSRSFTFLLVKYSPTFTAQGVELQLELAAEKVVQQVLDKRNRSWPAGMTATEIFNDIADKRDWDTAEVVEDSVGVLPEMQQTGESDVSFIRKILLPKTANVDKQSFVFFIDAENKAHFHSDSFLNHVGVVYNFARNSMGNVISFAPSDESLVQRLLGAGNSKFVGIDSAEGTSIKTEGTDTGGLDGAKKITYPDAGYTSEQLGDMKAWVPIYARDQEELVQKAAYRLQRLRRESYKATLEVVGTHAVSPMDYVTVNYYNSDGKIHYLSGTFKVYEITHSVDSGGWKTTMELTREGTRQSGPKALRNESERSIAGKKDATTEEPETQADKAASQRAPTRSTVNKTIRTSNIPSSSEITRQRGGA
jgi:hypothetical protein